MITMQNFINSTNTQRANSLSISAVNKENIESTTKNTQDSFEKQESKKTSKKKAIKITAAITAVLAGILAFIKRKEISNFISKIFKKSNNTISASGENIKPDKIGETISNAIDNATDKITSVFPTPKFTSNPTIKQRDEYVDNLLEFFKSTQDANAKLKALKEIEKYGIADLSCIAENLIGGGNEAIMQETLRIYSKWGSPDDAYQVIEPIVTSEISITQEKTFIEVLKTIQKLAKLENDSVQDREIVLKPIRRLLKHENENVRKMAQETLDKIIK